MKNLAKLRVTLCAGTAILCLSQLPALAQAVAITLPEEPMSEALKAIAQKTGQNILFTPESVAGVRAHTINGNMNAFQAVRQLTIGTHLEAVADGSGGIIVRTAAPAPVERAVPTVDSAPVNTSVSTPAETVVVTSSRVIADAANSPTPLTVMTTAQLQATTPTTLSEALSKLPAFVGSYGARTVAAASRNSAGDALNLRDFGANRTLVLFDSKRVVSSSQDGTINVSALPQLLMQRVDVVTGGASAVYGSDAVTGVVNFVLDKHFTGWKVDANAGISNYEDGALYNFGVAAGSDLFGGRGHIEGDVRAYHADNIFNEARKNGASAFLLTGLGTAANPYVVNTNVTIPAVTYGGKITCTGCAANGQQFIANGVVGPFNAGTATGSGAFNIGGDGAQAFSVSLSPLQAQEESFLRFSYNINDDVTFYVQGAVDESYLRDNIIPNYITTGATASSFFSNNPFLPAAAQAALANPSGKFTNNIFWHDQGPWGGQLTNALVDTQSVTVGLDGVWGKYNWSVFYTHGQSRTKVSNPHNQNNQKQWAANDAVVGAGGTIQCYISTTSYASLYPGCVPINTFGPTALTSNQYNYFIQSTNYVESDMLDDVGASIAGEVFDNWAGPVKAALSFESRWLSLGLLSNANPGFVDCTGLRLCNTFTPLYGGVSVTTMPTASQNVWEVAGEVSVPLLKNAPLVQELNLDVAGRYTDYSTSGSVETWKIGLDYHVNDEVRFRATNSVDIRAPNLYELFQPISVQHSAMNDPHTNSSPGVSLQTSGNPNLTPEISRTYTAGMVFTPEFIPGLTASIDYYHINMTNVITAISGVTPAVLNLCESSGGTSAYCALVQRPLPFSNTTTNNTPSLVISSALNTAFQRTEGWDLELDYGFEVGDVWADAPGSINLRMLANIAPVLESIPFTGSPVNFTGVREVLDTTAVTTTSKGHVSSFVTYNLGSWTFNLLDRWISGRPRAIYYGLIYAQPRVNSVNYQDITIDKKFTIDDQSIDGYLTIQNVGNIQPPSNLATLQTNPGQNSTGLTSLDRGIYDEVGRFFTLGIRARF